MSDRTEDSVLWEIKIGEDTFAFDFEKELAPPISPVRMAEAMALLAAARSQLDTLQGEYRGWKANSILEASNKRRAGKPVPEWKAVARVEATPEFLQYQLALATARETVGVLEALVTGMAAEAIPSASLPIPGLPDSSPLPLTKSS